MNTKIKTLNGYEIVDEEARQRIKAIEDNPPTVDLTGYATEDWVNEQGYLTEHQSLEDYAKKSELPTVPTKVSELENDKGYLTEHQSLDGYATEDYVDQAIANIDFPESGTGGSSSTSENKIFYIDTRNWNALFIAAGRDQTAPEDAEAFAKYCINNNYPKDVVVVLQIEHSSYDIIADGNSRQTVADIVYDTENNVIHLSFTRFGSSGRFQAAAFKLYLSSEDNYWHITCLNTYNSEIDVITTSELTAKGYLTSIPTEYVTETELAGKGYLTEHQSLAGYATETYVTDAITSALNNIANAEDGSY
ncbi:MAG: hypothetical protein IKB64_08610 [Paludibacteraceae bacterium]|nr:hypothetical protein [Paludibacteraceae bacterium]